MSQAAPAYMAVDFQYQCIHQNQSINNYVAQYHGNVMRVIVGLGHQGQGLACVRAAAEAGYKVYLSLQYPNAYLPSQVAAYFRYWLPRYAPYLWAVGVGNEQDLNTVGGQAPRGRTLVRVPHTQTAVVPAYTTYSTKRARVSIRRHRKVIRRWLVRRVAVVHPAHQVTVITYTTRPSNKGEDYTAIWNAVEPVLTRLAPRAVRVYGEITPFNFAVIKEGILAQPKGVEAVAMHCYHLVWSGGGIVYAPQAAAWLEQYRLPLWCSEMGPDLHGQTSWAVQDTWDSWNTLVDQVEQQSPNLQMVSYYDWPKY